jgi:hypothetical protein
MSTTWETAGVPNPDRVLLRKSTDGTWVEVGILVQRIKGKTWRMVLPDGSEVDHEIQGSESWSERGSIAHRLRTDPRGVEAALETTPEEVFRQVLAAFPKGAKAAQLKDALAGVDRRLVDKGWLRAKKQFETSEDIKRSSAKVPTYSLTAQPITTAPEPELAATHSNEPRSASLVPALAHEPSDAVGAGSTTGTDTAGETPANSGATATPEPQDEASADPLVEFLKGHGFAGPAEDLNSLTRRPLALGQMLSRLKAKELSDLLPALEERHRILLAAMVGSGKEKLLEAEAARVPPSSYESVLRAARREVAGASDDTSRLLASLTVLMGRATSSHPMSRQLLVDLAVTYGNEARKRPSHRERVAQARTGLAKALEAVAQSFKADPPASTDDADFARLAQAARQAPFARTGGRSFLVATLFRHDPHLARSHTWWEGATFDELAEAGHGPLAAALEDRTIAEQVVRPLVDAALQQVETRSRLGQIIAAPQPVARWTSGDALKEAFLRTAYRDEVASAWAEALTDTRHLARKEDELSAVRSDLGESMARQRDLEKQVAHLEHRLQVTGEDLAAARGAQGDARGVHERQVKADLVRVLAKVAAQVSQSVEASQDAGLMRTIGHATAREGLEPIGSVGHRSTFDPRLHDSLGHTISSDTQVTVVRPGYTWQDGTEVLVLLKAQVVTDGE